MTSIVTVIGVSNLQQIIVIMYVETKQLVVDEILVHSSSFMKDLFIHSVLITE